MCVSVCVFLSLSVNVCLSQCVYVSLTLPKKAFAISYPSPVDAPVINTVLMFVDIMFSFQGILIPYGFYPKRLVYGQVELYV